MERETGIQARPVGAVDLTPAIERAKAFAQGTPRKVFREEWDALRDLGQLVGELHRVWSEMDQRNLATGHELGGRPVGYVCSEETRERMREAQRAYQLRRRVMRQAVDGG